MTPLAVSTDDILGAFKRQADYCRARDAGLTAAVIDAAAADIRAGGPMADLVEGFSEDPGRAALALRIAGAAHYLAIKDCAGPLQSMYQSLIAPEPDALAAALAGLVCDHQPVCQSFASRPPQTNEINRLATLVPAFSEVVTAFDMPLDLYELGASGGLLLAADRASIDYGALTWGDGPVGVKSDWRGSKPTLPARLNIRGRRGCDRNPIDYSDPEQLDIARSYIWPEDRDRRTRFESAIAATRNLDIRVDAADALDWLAARELPKAGAVSVVFTSVFAVYLNDTETARLSGLMAAIGARATLEAPVAFVQFEPEETLDFVTFHVDVTMWPGGERRRIAKSHAHGAWVEPISN